MKGIEQLPAQLARRNWLILALLLLGSLPLGEPALSGGILAGGLIAILAFSWMRRSLEKLLRQPPGGARFRYQFGYVVRLAALAIVLALLVAVVKVHTVGLLIGLAVVIINLLWTTALRALG
jgi:hypothetical protein